MHKIWFRPFPCFSCLFSLCFLKFPWWVSIFICQLARQPAHCPLTTQQMLASMYGTTVNHLFLITMMWSTYFHLQLHFWGYLLDLLPCFDFLLVFSCLPPSFSWLLYWQTSWLFGGLVCLLKLDRLSFLAYFAVMKMTMHFCIFWALMLAFCLLCFGYLAFCSGFYMQW